MTACGQSISERRLCSLIVLRVCLHRRLGCVFRAALLRRRSASAFFGPLSAPGMLAWIAVLICAEFHRISNIEYAFPKCEDCVHFDKSVAGRPAAFLHFYVFS